MRRSRLPQGGGNVFQKIRQKRELAFENGQELVDLSIGEPKGPALLSARKAASQAVMSDDEIMHAYQYNDSFAIPGFSRRFINAHIADPLPEKGIGYLPIPGIKPILGLIPLACGCSNEKIKVGTMSDPGYPIPANWCEYHPSVTHYNLPLTSENGFRFKIEDIDQGTDLLMLNYPHNPSGRVADTSWFSEICEFCVESDIRLFNDAAYFSLSHSDASVALCEIADAFLELSWMEAFTAAKLIGNGTGWHVGTLVGSPDFIGDLKEIKGKTDAGFVAPMAAGALAAIENDQRGISEYRETYSQRLEILVSILTECGMRLAIYPEAGFYTLWEVPNEAFGERIQSAEHFNFLMIERTGVVGVHFANYLRYAVCNDIQALSKKIENAFRVVNPYYS